MQKEWLACHFGRGGLLKKIPTWYIFLESNT